MVFSRATSMRLHSKQRDWRPLATISALGAVLLLLAATDALQPDTPVRTMYFHIAPLMDEAAVEDVREEVSLLEGVALAEVIENGRTLKVHMDTQRIEPSTVRLMLECGRYQSEWTTHCQIRNIRSF